DGVNETFNLYYVGSQPIQIQKFQIFDRWGGLIFERKDIIIGNQVEWDGGNFPSGTYVYSMVVEDIKGNIEEIKGWINLVR
ncbi:MAG: hypothetical protein RJA52_592, partial [Bacteroidota bacterium]